MDKNLDGFLNFKNKKDGKKEMLQRFKEEKEQKKLNNLKNEKAIIIQKNVKNFLTLQKLKTQLLNQSITRFEDSEKILNKLKQVNRDFNMPLKLLNDFIRNFNFICFKLSPKNKLLSQTKKILPYLGFWLQKSFKAEEQTENIYFQFFNSLLHGSEERLAQDLLRMPRISKDKDENIQDRSYLNIKKFISNIFKYYQNWPPQLSAAMSEFFDTNKLAILKLVLNRNVTQINQQNDIYQFKDKINDYFALLSFIQLALNTITPAQLEHILDYTNIVSEKLKSLYKNISILFEYNFAVKLINAVFVIKQDENNKAKQESKDIVFSDSFNPMIAMFVIAIYSRIMVLCYNKKNYRTIKKNQEDFFTQMKAIPKEQLPIFIKILINIIADILFIPQNPKEQVLCNFLVEIGSKLLKLLYEYNYILEFLPKDQWLIKKDYVEELLVEFTEMHFQRLYIVKIIPFGFKFEDRINLLIRRNNIFEDGYQAFTQLNQLNLHGKIAVFYIDEMGVEETGIDAGGIFKEFLTDLSKIVFDPNYGMFKLQENNQQLYPSPFSQQLLGSDHLNIFYFLGQVIGRGIYDNILLPAIFSKFFLRSILGKQNHLIELQSLDKELYKNLKYLKDYKGDATDLGLNFTVHNSQEQEVELIQNGKEIAVDNKNKYKYIYLVAGYKLNNEIQKQTQYFTDGLKKVIDINWLQMFDEEELQLLICGDRKALDVEDLRSNSAYEGYSKNESYIKEFYKILSKFDDKLQYKFIKFVTSCERAPLLGFKNLYPQFTIVRVDAEHAIEQGLGFHLA
ncbi:HECT-domain-containing protein [Pseudocohnilembus persalinus]|uniref:HECT-type E3 ubiquitin transferase n=1 Tax=Pseudocohnilembus persalinus TaxID=266149 RepID=A0A0V0R5I2_PSEPJ|nr:HECT-domain-containing protein [Pseudocohnilembus persalinus]|eukprot:KRX09600.1 HECT-domain-containing protein [Pseudocohnilembus persalinus]